MVVELGKVTEKTSGIAGGHQETTIPFLRKP
jgi:hypothetical protein